MEKMKSFRFPTPSMDEWVKRSKKVLNGQSIQSLYSETYEGIILKPLYTKADEQQIVIPQYPGQADFRRGNKASGYLKNEWKIAQQISVSHGASVEETFREAFQKGQSAISFTVDEWILSKLEELEPFVEQYPFCVNGKNHQQTMIEKLCNMKNRSDISGYVGKDPIALYVEFGANKDSVKEDYDHFYHIVKKSSTLLPNVRTILIDTTPYHNGGANAVQELAIAISTAVHHIEQLRKRGLSIDTIASKIVAQFSIGSNFFMELAKIRAARILWSTICKAYEVDESLHGFIISATTSQFTKTVYDPYVNLIRSGNEAFAAVLGFVDYLHVTPFNDPEEKNTSFSDRIARNVQLLLKEETNISKTIDPAGGSYFIESITNELAEKSWELFLQWEGEGGIVEVLKSGKLQQEISEVRKKREHDLFVRKQTIVGTNKYANPNDEPLQLPQKPRMDKQSGEFIRPIMQRRLSEPYEQLRREMTELKKSDSTLAVGLITLGKLKEYTKIEEFATGFFATGGMDVISSDEVETIEEAINFVKETNLKYYCLCGSDHHYHRIGFSIAKKIKSAFPDVSLFIAGDIHDNEREKWISAGIDQFIHENSNSYELLTSILKERKERK